MRRIWQLPLWAAAVLLLASRTEAQAGAFSILDQFNAIVFGDFTSTADVEGRTVIGGNLVAGATFYNNPSPQETASSLGALTVYGNIGASNWLNINDSGSATIAGSNSASFNMNGNGSLTIGGSNSGGANRNGGSVFIGGSNSGNINLNNGSKAYVAGTNSGNINPAGSVSSNYSYANVLPDFTTAFKTPLQNLSVQLAAAIANSQFPANASLNGNFNNVQINATPDANGTAVFSVIAAQLSQYQSFQINPHGAKTIIINVDCGGSGCSYTDNANSELTGEQLSDIAPRVIWNFYDAGTLTFNREFIGTVLAPNATVTNSSPIDGTDVANRLIATGELHNDPPNDLTSIPVVASAAAPEPASLSLLGTALVGLAALRRRRKLSSTAARQPKHDWCVLSAASAHGLPSAIP